MLGSGCFKLLSQAPSFGLSPCCPRQPIMSVHCVFNMLPWLVGCFDVPRIFRGKTHKLYPLPDMPSRSGSRATQNFGIISCWNNNGSGWGTSCDYPGMTFSAKLCWTFAQPVEHLVIEGLAQGRTILDTDSPWDGFDIKESILRLLMIGMRGTPLVSTGSCALVYGRQHNMSMSFTLILMLLCLAGGWLVSWIVLKGGDVCALMPLRIFQDFAACWHIVFFSGVGPILFIAEFFWCLLRACIFNLCGQIFLVCFKSAKPKLLLAKFLCFLMPGSHEWNLR